ncbi:restriction endonuclease subunit S [Barnesiella viscericola]|uniref:restriction endonuclease subunit S n=1 Tax=Barnesiella viscericola TaxID=397865 RepID=UPI0025A39AEF|nr:restriction endonuclease subunit S [Barnesiella viscericola]MDM8268577.1 restriction endonuclease subunit S [Barnesiella viscericola]
MSEWKTYRLGEIGTVVGGATPSTTVEEYYGGEIPWLTPKDLSTFQGRYIERGNRNITYSGLNSCSAQLLPEGSVLFSSRAPIGYVAIAKNPIATNQGFKSIIPNIEKVDSLFLYYLLKYNKGNIEAMGSGTTFKEISGATMKNIEVLIPHLDEQRKIAGILGALDDKIELNRRINANLEEQAQALFKSWFVDFEPFKDGPFVDSELGEIPQGWKVNTIEDLASYIASGGTPRTLDTSYYDGDIRWFTTKELKDGFLFDSEKHISQTALENSAAKLFPQNTVLMAIYASPTVGRLGILTAESTCNQAAVGIIAKEEIGYIYLYLLLLSERVNLNNLASGAAQQNLNVGIIKRYRVLVPPIDILNVFNKVITPIFSIIRNNTAQIYSLSALRDALLPKLMKGEIKVN